MTLDEAKRMSPEAIKARLRALTGDENKRFFAEVNSSNENKAAFLSLFVGEDVTVRCSAFFDMPKPAGY